MSLYSNSLGVAIAQNSYATDSGSEIQALRELLDRVELSGLLPLLRREPAPGLGRIGHR